MTDTGSSSGAADGPPPGGTLILLRHGRSTANGQGVLAGRTPGVDLDETGVAQAAALVGRLAGARIARVVSSPQRRCRSTVAPLAAALGLEVVQDDRVAEVDYGRWTGRTIADLAGEELWRTVQAHPAAAVFPDGEALAAVSARAGAGAREHAAAAVRDGAVVLPSGDAPAAVSARAVARAREHGAAAGDAGAVLLCSHGDVIKAILADALGMHLDLFQRLVVGPASVSVVRYGALRTFVERMNDTGSLAGVGAPPEPAGADGGPGRHADDAVIGGDTGGNRAGTPGGPGLT